MDREGNEVRRIVDDRALAGDTKHRFRWDGRDDEGDPLPDGVYRMRVVRRDEGRVIDSFKRVRIDREPPQVRLVSAEPGVIAPREPGQNPEVTLRYEGPRNNAPEFRVFRTDDAAKPHVVRRFRGDGRTRRLARRGGHRPREHRAGARRRLRLHASPCATARATSPWRRPRSRAPGSRGPAPAWRRAASR